MHAHIRRICVCSLFAALITIGAFLRVPVPPMGMITLQLFFVLLSAIVLGPAWGALAVVVYNILGLAGAPVFATGGGITYFTQPTFGFVYGFIPSTLVAGFTAKRIRSASLTSLKSHVWASVAGCIAALLPLYICGTAHGALTLRFVLNKDVNLWSIIWGWCLVYLPFDLIKAVAAGYAGALIVRRLPPKA